MKRELGNNTKMADLDGQKLKIVQPLLFGYEDFNGLGDLEFVQ